jgi:hypothetical protein
VNFQFRRTHQVHSIVRLEVPVHTTVGAVENRIKQSTQPVMRPRFDPDIRETQSGLSDRCVANVEVTNLARIVCMNIVPLRFSNVKFCVFGSEN